MIISELKEFVFSLLYTTQKYNCYLIDFIREIFYKLSGVEKVRIDNEDKEILSFFIESDSALKTFYLILLVGVILLFVFTIIAIIKSEKEEKKETKGSILLKALRAFILLILTPFIVYALVELTSAVLISLNSAMNESLNISQNTKSIGAQIFIVSAYDAYIGEEGIRDFIEDRFLSGELSYLNKDDIIEYYNLEDINYVVGIISSLTILIMFILSILSFIQRIFDVILLYLVSPLPLSALPLDEGKFKAFKELFISKLISSYGIILSMNLLFLIVPKINEIRFFDDSFKNGVIHIIFLIGGVFAVTRSNLIIQKLLESSMDGSGVYQLLHGLRGGAMVSAKGANIVKHIYEKTPNSMQQKIMDKGKNYSNKLIANIKVDRALKTGKLEDLIKYNGKNNK